MPGIRSGAHAVPSTGAVGGAADRSPGALGRRLDSYLAAVARELRARGVITGTPQRADPAQRLLGSIVLDCTAVRVAAWTPTAGDRSIGRAIHPDRPAPVVLTWDEELGWCAGLHHDATRSSRRYLHTERLPAPDVVAEFVVGLALDESPGSVHPPRTTAPDGHSRLRLIR